jgi:precorrin-2 dehydrogenase/sirohydrochlorin ferrochelatase
MNKKENIGFFPILINLQRFPCLVVGGGKVAHRKVLSLLEFNADITVISPKICNALVDLYNQHKIKIIKKTYSKEYLRYYKIVFSATDNHRLNLSVRQDCNDENILLNVADNPPLCDFILPANVKRGNLTISVSSQGKAPFYTKEIKKKLEQFIPPVYKDIIELAGDFRKRMLAKGKTESVRTKAKIFRRFTSKDWEKILEENGKRNSRHYFQKILKEFNLF